MKCEECGKESDGDDFELQTYVTGGSRNLSHVGQDPRAYWVCRDCANYRRGTFRLIFWIVGVLGVLALISLLAKQLGL
jgi:hypothetical protein